METRLCPLYCLTDARERVPMERDKRYGDFACPACGIAGAAETLDRVTPRSRKLTQEELNQLAAMPLEPWDALEQAAEEQDPGHLLRVNAALRAKVEGLRRAMHALDKERAWAREELAKLTERVTTIADEATGPHPVQTAEEALTCIERALFERRVEIERLKAGVEQRHG